MRAVILAVWFVAIGGAVSADARLTILMDALKIAETAETMREEGLAQAADLESEYLGGQGGDFWSAQVERIFDIDAASETVRAALGKGLDDADRDAAIMFFDSERGDRIVTLENAARIAMNDPAIEAAVGDQYRNLRQNPDHLLEQIDRMVAAGDLTERNVGATMSANYRFLSGLADGRMLDMGEQEILQDVWADEARIREAADLWLHGFMLLAYTPLSVDDVDAYIAFSETEAGRALNAALFEGYGAVYADTSYALGRLIALSASGSDL